MLSLPAPPEQTRCLVAAPALPERPGRTNCPAGAAPDDLARYEQDRTKSIDYRQRMLMNVIAIAIVTLLVGAGVWIADTITDLERDQDCVMQGRANCAPIEMPVPNQQ